MNVEWDSSVQGSIHSSQKPHEWATIILRYECDQGSQKWIILIGCGKKSK